MVHFLLIFGWVGWVGLGFLQEISVTVALREKLNKAIIFFEFELGYDFMNKKILEWSNSARKFMKIFWAQTFLTQNLPGPNFFKLSVPGNLRVFRAFASLFTWGLESQF